MKSFNAGIVMVVALIMAAPGFMGCPSNGAKLESITVTPVDPVIVTGIQFTATGTFSDGMVLNYTSEVTWSSSDETVATVGTTAGTTGYVTVLSSGTTTITAVEPYNNFTSSSVLTVPTPSAITITITPENPVMTIGKTHQFTAIALWSNATASQSLMSSPTLTWWSSSNAMATVSGGYVTAGTTTGTVDIFATDTIFSSISGTTQVTIIDTMLKSIEVTPSSWETVSSIPTTSRWFRAFGTFEDLVTFVTSTSEVTSWVNWTSSSTGTVLVSNTTGSKGYATAESAGSAYVIATDPITNVTGSASVTVANP